MDDGTSSTELLRAARDAFPCFYTRASGDDASMMDALVMAHAAVVVGFNAPRAGVVAPLRDQVERTTDAAERVFTELREVVRTTATFRALPGDERLAIETLLFSPATREL